MIGVTDIVIRQLSAATIVNGKRVPGIAGEPSTIRGSIQPADGSDIKAFPDSVRESIKLVMYTTSTLNTYDKALPHQVQYDSEWYDITKSAAWDNLLVHNVYFLCKVKEGD